MTYSFYVFYFKRKKIIQSPDQIYTIYDFETKKNKNKIFFSY